MAYVPICAALTATSGFGTTDVVIDNKCKSGIIGLGKRNYHSSPVQSKLFQFYHIRRYRFLETGKSKKALKI